MNTLRIVFGVVLAFVIIVAMVGFIRFNFTNGGDIIPEVNANVAEVACDNGQEGSATYYAPDARNIMQRLLLVLSKDGATTTYHMVPARAASGAKFETEDGAYYFWEHQDVFRLGKGEETITECRKKDASLPTQGTMTEPEARAIAEKSCVKGGVAVAPGFYNEMTRTWWFNANLNATRPGCNPACVVSDDTKEVEINWRCTGLIE